MHGLTLTFHKKNRVYTYHKTHNMAQCMASGDWISEEVSRYAKDEYPVQTLLYVELFLGLTPDLITQLSEELHAFITSMDKIQFYGPSFQGPTNTYVSRAGYTNRERVLLLTPKFRAFNEQLDKRQLPPVTFLLSTPLTVANS